MQSILLIRSLSRRPFSFSFCPSLSLFSDIIAPARSLSLSPKPILQYFHPLMITIYTCQLGCMWVCVCVCVQFVRNSFFFFFLQLLSVLYTQTSSLSAISDVLFSSQCVYSIKPILKKKKKQKVWKGLDFCGRGQLICH